MSEDPVTGSLSATPIQMRRKPFPDHSTHQRLLGRLFYTSLALCVVSILGDLTCVDGGEGCVARADYRVKYYLSYN